MKYPVYPKRVKSHDWYEVPEFTVIQRHVSLGYRWRSQEDARMHHHIHKNYVHHCRLSLLMYKTSYIIHRITSLSISQLSTNTTLSKQHVICSYISDPSHITLIHHIIWSDYKVHVHIMNIGLVTWQLKSQIITHRPISSYIELLIYKIHHNSIIRHADVISSHLKLSNMQC